MHICVVVVPEILELGKRCGDHAPELVDMRHGCVVCCAPGKWRDRLCGNPLAFLLCPTPPVCLACLTHSQFTVGGA